MGRRLLVKRFRQNYQKRPTPAPSWPRWPALAKRIEDSLAGRQGGDRKSKDKHLPLDNEPQGKSSAIAADKAGFNNPETYRQAKHVALNRQLVQNLAQVTSPSFLGSYSSDLRTKA